MDLSDGGDGIDWFFMAMALARRNEDLRAREFYDRADRWMAQSNALDGELRRFRREAAGLLQIPPGDDPDGAAGARRDGPGAVRPRLRRRHAPRIVATAIRTRS
jgi:hypothetical protein